MCELLSQYCGSVLKVQLTDLTESECKLVGGECCCLDLPESIQEKGSGAIISEVSKRRICRNPNIDAK